MKQRIAPLSTIRNCSGLAVQVTFLRGVASGLQIRKEEQGLCGLSCVAGPSCRQEGLENRVTSHSATQHPGPEESHPLSILAAGSYLTAKGWHHREFIIIACRRPKGLLIPVFCSAYWLCSECLCTSQVPKSPFLISNRETWLVASVPSQWQFYLIICSSSLWMNPASA